ncbi:hypothetical protein [Nocardia carnea]|uniref:hypothetical protein n=1 Tax=Nocardia carnea TaxID=37328 RepID=UPI002454D536|nr:hypothetical protein [Nocardia carnea]
MVEVGDVVRIGESGGSDFVVREVDERFVVREVDERENRAVIEAVEDAPGRYPFSMPLSALVPERPG